MAYDLASRASGRRGNNFWATSGEVKMDDELRPYSGHDAPEGLVVAVKAICWAAAILIFGMPTLLGFAWIVGATVEHFTP